MALPIAFLLAHIVAGSALLLPGFSTKRPQMTILLAVVVIILVLNLIVFEVYCNALLIAHMDT